MYPATDVFRCLQDRIRLQTDIAPAGTAALYLADDKGIASEGYYRNLPRCRHPLSVFISGFCNPPTAVGDYPVQYGSTHAAPPELPFTAEPSNG